ncbi:glycerol-3-phosphate 1-O-acyltransferase PlsB [Pantoea sp. SoEX]|uniref:glycerol-3-phosphate 1-O-acyltransferase PlsB n=1 Tax=Pantoea sp. SoEX TaxID=2576763 RepID=UPI001357A2A7|nr:glycerol-3-phosphate 1-O-acyltransferase PlsB [Pantoea sp. SoEX]MXP51068.1 glycerol-3-phosphate 1-O-acyltransferase PlsB [Pantoea sp. SoEX]
MFKFNWYKIYLNLVDIIVSIAIRSKIVTIDDICNKNINKKTPLIYILPDKSMLNLLILRKQCIKYKLPDPLSIIEINGMTLPCHLFINDNRYLHSYLIPYWKLIKSIKILRRYIRLVNKHEIKILLISVVISRSPNFNSNIDVKQKKKSKVINILKKMFIIIWHGRNVLIYSSSMISLNKILLKNNSDRNIIKKLVRIAHIYFIRQKINTIGPNIIKYKDLLLVFLKSKTLKKIIKQEAKQKHITYKISKNNAIKIINEIASNISYEAIYLTDYLMKQFWNIFYEKININGYEKIYKLVSNGHKIVYIPCHRSHIDYLLISYVLYNKGFSIPYIAAGQNLNFWPIGGILRSLGAFFIRRKFKNNKLYCIIFRKYLDKLFNYGCSIEYFIEGQRSRTGFLLKPRTGLLTMTLQSIIKNNGRNLVTLVPIYIGYDNILEINYYSNELSGKTKKDKIIQKLRNLFTLCRLRNLGHIYVNFGEPLTLNSYLNKYVPEWYKSRNNINKSRPIWLTPLVNNLAIKLMTRINEASVAGAVNLCVTAIISSTTYSLTQKELTDQLNFYIELLNKVPYSSGITIPMNTNEIIAYIIKCNKFKIKKKDNTEIIFTLQDEVKTILYYRNNIQHMLIMPSLIATIIINFEEINIHELINYVKNLYPIVKRDLFLCWECSEIPSLITKICNQLEYQKLISSKKEKLFLQHDRSDILRLLSYNAREMLQRYIIIFHILKINQIVNNKLIETESIILSQSFLSNKNIYIPEFFDQCFFRSILSTLRNQKYIYINGNVNKEKTLSTYNVLYKILNNKTKV